MSISWVLLRDEAGGEHHEHQLGAFPASCPPKTQTLAKPFAPVIVQMRQEASIMSISWVLFRPHGPLSSSCIMSISWVLFSPHGPLFSRRFQ